MNEDVLVDSEEPGIHPLEVASRRLEIGSFVVQLAVYPRLCVFGQDHEKDWADDR